jgi:hypothetical protein
MIWKRRELCREGAIRVQSHRLSAKALDLAGSSPPKVPKAKRSCRVRTSSSPWDSIYLTVETAFLCRSVHRLLDHPFCDAPLDDCLFGAFFLSGPRPPCASPESVHTQLVHTSLDHPPCRSHALLPPNEAAAGPVLDSTQTLPRAEAPPP